MLTFKDLVFKSHPNIPCMRTRAVLEFPNGYRVSVITRERAYTSNDKPYKVAIIHEGSLCYSTPITGNVIGYNTEDDVTEIMKKVQELPEDTDCNHNKPQE